MFIAKIRFVDHLRRMTDERIPKRIFQGRPGGKKPKGKPNKSLRGGPQETWCPEVETSGGEEKGTGAYCERSPGST